MKKTCAALERGIINFVCLRSIALMVLKLTGFIDWSWGRIYFPILIILGFLMFKSIIRIVQIIVTVFSEEEQKELD